ncbi:phosphoribosylamine--glycine ligase [Nesterenkonia sp.]|uniref:phosphoribosylamine--glycine ligase n=1 Tax=Nesterenkonia sp. TaxID=704201 RepID=UPI0026025CD9|nr:phosphoribosylamine--glycine ligase [Nesterenkonia sp.]
MKVLVVGPGGREHAIIRALRRDPAVQAVEAAPGNAGIARQVTCHDAAADDGSAIAALAVDGRFDLVVIGPEAPLAAGVADAVREAGIPVFGPSQQAAQLEASKAFAKEVMAAAGVPTAQAVHAADPTAAADALDRFGAPYVVKDDGLAAGKGVVVTEDRSAALAHAESCFAAGGTVVIEEFLDGPEVSLFVLCDGQNLVPLSPAQDFKRIFDQDQGPNTGGMGAYTPLDWLENYTETDDDGAVRDFTSVVVEKVARPTVQEMAARGTPFVGVLYCGLAVTSRGVRVVEFNVRFGDPETQAVLERLETGLGRLLLDAACGRLGEDRQLQWRPGSAVDVVLAAENYPDSPRKGDVITGVEDAEQLDGVAVLHAGTAVNDDGALVTSGGRVVAVVATGESLQEAVQRAYAGADRISWPGMQYRTDIAAKAVRGEISVTSPSNSVQTATSSIPAQTGGPGAPNASAAAPSPAPAPSAAAAAERSAAGADWAPGQQLPGWQHVASGKVRELYQPAPGSAWAGQDVLLMVATDRISAYDHVLTPGIPGKGAILTQLSLWWFQQLDAEGIGHHVVTSEPGPDGVPQQVAGRALIVRRMTMVPAEAIVRGYLTGSGLLEYQKHGTVTGISLPEGLQDGSQLPEPIFTPSTKAEQGDHDENITFHALAEQNGADLARRLRETSLRIYRLAEERTREAGILLADTKFEFGLDDDGELVLADEVLTPDSSRFWPAEAWQPGGPQPSFDKQFVRNWLTSPDSRWDRAGGQEPPALPEHIVRATRERYVDAFRRITGAEPSL